MTVTPLWLAPGWMMTWATATLTHPAAASARTVNNFTI